MFTFCPTVRLAGGIKATPLGILRRFTQLEMSDAFFD
jgi:hypothetical protein